MYIVHSENFTPYGILHRGCNEFYNFKTKCWVKSPTEVELADYLLYGQEQILDGLVLNTYCFEIPKCVSGCAAISFYNLEGFIKTEKCHVNCKPVIEPTPEETKRPIPVEGPLPPLDHYTGCESECCDDCDCP